MTEFGSVNLLSYSDAAIQNSVVVAERLLIATLAMSEVIRITTTRIESF